MIVHVILMTMAVTRTIVMMKSAISNRFSVVMTTAVMIVSMIVVIPVMLFEDLGTFGRRGAQLSRCHPQERTKLGRQDHPP